MFVDHRHANLSPVLSPMIQFFAFFILLLPLNDCYNCIIFSSFPRGFPQFVYIFISVLLLTPFFLCYSILPRWLLLLLSPRDFPSSLQDFSFALKAIGDLRTSPVSGAGVSQTAASRLSLRCFRSLQPSTKLCPRIRPDSQKAEENSLKNSFDIKV